jgi:hypothetical protein
MGMASKADGEYSAAAALSSTTVTVKVSCSTTTARIKLSSGHWKVGLRGADATCTVYLKLGADNTVTVAEPADTADAGDASATTAGTMSFRGDEVERVHVPAATLWVAYILSAAASTNKLVFTKIA